MPPEDRTQRPHGDACCSRQMTVAATAMTYRGVPSPPTSRHLASEDVFSYESSLLNLFVIVPNFLAISHVFFTWQTPDAVIAGMPSYHPPHVLFGHHRTFLFSPP